MTAVATPPAAPGPPEPSEPAVGASSLAPSTATSARRRAAARPAAARWGGIARDIVGMLLLGLLALSAFGPAFGGSRYLLVGGVGLIAGGMLALVAAERRWSGLWVVAGVAVLLVLAGPALVAPGQAAGGVLPTPSAVAGVLTGATRGWHNLLTTVPPVGSTGWLLAVPWAAGLVCGAASMSLARRGGRWAVIAVAPAFVVLGLGILEGTDRPAWAGQAAVMTVVAVAWASLRQRAERSTGPTASAGIRWIGALAMLAAAGLLGHLVAGSDLLTGGGRYVARDEVTPPREDLPTTSPLESFRRYRTTLADTPVFRVVGLVPGQRLRLAAMDVYDGEAWRVDPEAGYQRVGDRISADGETGREIRIDVASYDGLWVAVPDGPVGAVRFVEPGERTAALADGLRVGPSTDSVADVARLAPGVAYVVEAGAPPRDVAAGQPAGAASPRVDRVRAVDAFRLRVEQRLTEQERAGSPLEKLRGLQRLLTAEDSVVIDEVERRGYFSDGKEGQPYSEAGHSGVRLATMLGERSVEGIDPSPFVVGNEEQYAAVLAQYAAALGFPTRVVLGFRPEDDQAVNVTFTGKDVSAWIEVAVDGQGWVPLYGTRPDGKPPTQQTKQPEPPPEAQVPPPPSSTTTLPLVRQRPSEGCVGDACAAVCTGVNVVGACLPPFVGTVGKLAGPPLLVLFGLTAGMALVKGLRRRRRRSRGRPDERVAAGWDEVCDYARDLGDVVVDKATRRETAVLLARPGLADLAKSADGIVFAPGELTEAEVAAYWDRVELTRSAMRSDVSLFNRWTALVNPTSLRSAARRRSAGTKGRARLRAPGRARPALQGATA